MPLHREERPLTVGMLERLDGAIRSRGNDSEAFTKVFYGLVVDGVDAVQAAADDASDPRISVDQRLGVRLVGTLPDDVVSVRASVARQVLDQGATEGDVEHLVATTDRHRRHLALVRLPHEGELEFVALVVDHLYCFVPFCSVAFRSDIPAAGEDQSVDPVEYGVKELVLDGEEEDRDAATAQNGVGICVKDEVGKDVVRGGRHVPGSRSDADDRMHSQMLTTAHGSASVIRP